jgi:hypothetical protein
MVLQIENSSLRFDMNPTEGGKIICSEFAHALAAKAQCDPLEFFSDKFKSIREWLILGHAGDFIVYATNGEKIGGLEIAEAMRPGYLRHKWFKDHSGSQEPYPMDRPLADPWQTLRTTIAKKANKNYPSDTALLVYLNVSLLYFKDWELEVLHQLIEEHSRTPFECVDHFREVLVLDSEMSGLARLHPQPEVLFIKKCNIIGTLSVEVWHEESARNRLPKT